MITSVAMLALLLAGEAVSDTASVPRPTDGYVQRPACPFEGCQYGTWTTEGPLPVYAAEGDTTQIAFEFASGETIAAHSGTIHMERVGRVVVRRPTGRFDVGDTLLLLGYEGEGNFPVWHEGKVVEADKFWYIPPNLCAPYDSGFSDISDDSTRAVMVTAPMMDWWVAVSNAKGSGGWLRFRNQTNYGFWFPERIHGSDAFE